MSQGLAAAFFAAGVGTWIYLQFMKRSNNAKSSLVAAALVGAIAFLVFFTAFHVF